MANHFRFYEVKRVFLACPGDLTTERSRFPRLLETVNNLRAHSLGFHCEPVGWERVIPSFGRPQALINRELESADLVIVMFWNRIGSPSDLKNTKTGTLEEFELARRLYGMLSRPMVWVYFRVPTESEGDQVAGVAGFRKELEQGKDIFFREYSKVADWEDMVREHLVAYLDGLSRWDIERNREHMRPEKALLHGEFAAEGVWEVGTELTFAADLDGDGNDEIVKFRIDFHGYWLRVFKHGSGLSLTFPEEWNNPFEGDSKDFGTLQVAHTIHIGIKDVTNDGLPELLVAAHDGVIGLRIAVWGYRDAQLRKLEPDSFTVLGTFEGQRRAVVSNGGRLSLPYGTAGLFAEYAWNGTAFTEVA